MDGNAGDRAGGVGDHASYWQSLEALLVAQHPEMPRDQLLPWERCKRARDPIDDSSTVASSPVIPLANPGYWDALDNYLVSRYPDMTIETLLPWRGSTPVRPDQARAPSAAPPTTAAGGEGDDGCSSDCTGVDSGDEEVAEPGEAKSCAGGDCHSGSASTSGGGGSSSTAIAPLPDRSRNQWASRNRHKWECQSAVTKTAPAANLFVADELDKLAAYYKAVGGDEWRSFAFSKQAKIVRALSWEVTDATQLKGLRGFGDKSVAKVAELLKTGALRRLDALHATDRSKALTELTRIHGVGAKTASEWYARGIDSIEAAQRAGIMTDTQRVGARFWRDFQERIPRAEVSAIVDAVRLALRHALARRGVPAHALDAAADATAAGSYRRGKPSSGDVDVLLCRRDGGADRGLIEDVLTLLAEAGVSVHHLTHEDEVQRGGAQHNVRTAACSSYRGIVRLPGYQLHRRLDLKLYPPDEYAYALLYFTGSDHFNRSMRHYAKALGYSLSDHGIVAAVKMPGTKDNGVRGTTNLFHAVTEADIFHKLGLQYIEPSQRNTDVVPTGEDPRQLQ